jgi:hypothetical protein
MGEDIIVILATAAPHTLIPTPTLLGIIKADSFSGIRAILIK